MWLSEVDATRPQGNQRSEGAFEQLVNAGRAMSGDERGMEKQGIVGVFGPYGGGNGPEGACSRGKLLGDG